jgi:hypothetical protein
MTYGAPRGVTIRSLVIAEYVIPGICKKDNEGVKYQARNGMARDGIFQRIFLEIPRRRIDTHVAVMIVRLRSDRTNDCSKKIKA